MKSIKVLFVCRSHRDMVVPPIIKRQGESLIENGIHLDYFTIDGKGKSAYFKSVFRLKMKLKQESYDIVHAHYGLSGLVALFANKDIPKVISLMGDDVLGAKNSKGELSFPGQVLSRIIGFSLSAFNLIIVKSKEMKMKIGKHQSTVIPNGVSFEMFYPMDRDEARRILNLSNSDKIILFPANINRVEKNYKLLKDASKITEIENLKIIHFDNVPHNKTKYYFNAANLVVLTSFHEGSPNVIKEAMACNVQIISTNVGDVKEIISDTKGCLLCSQDPKDLSMKINRAFSQNIRTNGRAKISHLESGRIANRIVQLYKTLVN